MVTSVSSCCVLYLYETSQLHEYSIISNVLQPKALTKEQLKMSGIEMKQNLGLLCKAFEENKISKDLHDMATAMIQRCMDLKQDKLRCFFQQYMRFRAILKKKSNAAFFAIDLIQNSL